MPANGFEREIMIFDYSLAGLVSLGLLFYLTYALLRPERFDRIAHVTPEGTPP